MLIAACVKWVDLRPEIDPLRATVTPVGHDGGFSAADLAAVEVAIRLAQGWGAQSAAVCAGPPAADQGMRDLLASGIDRVVRIDDRGGSPGPIVNLGAGVAERAAAQLAAVLGDDDLGASVVVCGDLSPDLGSGAVPAYLAHHLGAEQALGLVELTPGAAGSLRVVRRLDGGRREVLDVTAPAVLSVEAHVAELRRAPLAATLAARDAEPERRRPASDGSPPLPGVGGEPPRLRPWRPPTRLVDAPTGVHALDRIMELTGSLVDRTPPRTVEADPAAAAAAIVDQLRSWGYLRES